MKAKAQLPELELKTITAPSIPAYLLSQVELR
jgi:hypothetical protein